MQIQLKSISVVSLSEEASHKHDETLELYIKSCVFSNSPGGGGAGGRLTKGDVGMGGGGGGSAVFKISSIASSKAFVTSSLFPFFSCLCF